MSAPSLSPTYREHHERIRSAILEDFSLDKVPEWISTKTFIEGAPFSFVDHEFQERILRDKSREINIKKCSQVGISELAVRRTLAIMDILPDLHVIYTLPSAGFAKTFAKTRIDPVITGSKYLRGRLNTAIDSFEMKQLGSSYLYIRGTIGQAAAISVPASLLVHDEVDFSDQTVLSSYHSRLTHSRYKLRFNLSTPTVPGYGIDEKFKQSRRFFQHARCNHCSHWFLPDYFEHVKIPGYSGDLREITKENLHTFDYQNAKVLCPRCGREPYLGPENRRWVLENPNEAHEAAGYQVSPFDAPRIITPAYLIKSSTQYKRYVDFINFNLGQCAQDKDNALTREELEALWVPGETPKFRSYVYGMDMGLICHMTVLGVTQDGVKLPVALARIPLAQFWERYNELVRTFRFSNAVVDSLPYTDIVMSLQRTNENIFGSVYTRGKQMELFTVTNRDSDSEAMKNSLRVVNINRNKALDALMAELRQQRFVFVGDACTEHKETWLDHMTDMRRLQQFDKDDELYFQWQKSSKGNDHFHHSLLYAYIASEMISFGEVKTPYGTVFSTFKNKSLQ